jgi:serine/threonine protein kinase
MLGEGTFGKVLLAKKKESDGSDERYAIKVLKKSKCSVSNTVIEKEALILASGHPFITTLYSCFQTKVFLNVLSLLCILQNRENGFHDVCLAVHLLVCPCGTTQFPLDAFSLNSNVSNLMKIFGNL